MQVTSDADEEKRSCNGIKSTIYIDSGSQLNSDSLGFERVIKACSCHQSRNISTCRWMCLTEASRSNQSVVCHPSSQPGSEVVWFR